MIAWNELPGRANQDPEFRYAARFWTATLRFDVGSASYRVRVENGAVAEAAPCAPSAACDVFVSAPESDWRELLAPTPRPFYQDLYGAQVHHGVRLPEDPVTYAAYYPALRRLLRALAACQEGAR
ncbi:MAG TPA: hypothetical protein VMR50_08290 [Myxococcota bacterium]|nr:hypothetical protein [Myxococcota bacterium]